MNNVRGLYPPLYGAPANGGGGGGGSIQVDTLPEASLEYKDKIVQYTGATTETLTNGYFYKCVEHTETAGDTITVTYGWDNIPVMEVDSGGGLALSTTETVIGTYDGKPLYGKILRGLVSGWNSGDAFKIPIAKLVYGDYQINTGNGVVLGAFSSGDYKISTMQFSNTDGIYISLSGSGWTLGDVTIAYTKTTD